MPGRRRYLLTRVLICGTSGRPMESAWSNPDLWSVNLSEVVRQVEVPVFFAEGRHDQLAPAEVAERYFSGLMAPRKEWLLFENSAHFPQLEERERFHKLLTSTVLPAAGLCSPECMGSGDAHFVVTVSGGLGVGVGQALRWRGNGAACPDSGSGSARYWQPGCPAWC